MSNEVFESPMAKAVYVAGGQSSLAKKVGVTQGAVWKWVRGIKKVSPVHAVAVSNAVTALTGNQLQRDLKVCCLMGKNHACSVMMMKGS